MMTPSQQRLADMCDDTARRLEGLARKWRQEAGRLRDPAAVQGLWTSVMIDEVVPGDRIIWAAVECDVIGTAVAAGRYVLTLDWPQTHGGTAAKVVRCQTPAAVQVRQELHARLTREWDTVAEADAETHAVSGVS